MSHYLYLHKDLAEHEDVWKAGITITPYSAVRSRQRFSWKQFGLDYLFFGRPDDIKALEAGIKKKFNRLSGKKLNGIGTQTELFCIKIESLLAFINTAIATYDLDIVEIKLEQPYTASSSGRCPFGVPSDTEAGYFLDRLCEEKFGALRGKVDKRTKTRTLERLVAESCYA